MAHYYCILFDADNTLLDFTAAENKALSETLAQYNIVPDAENMQKYRDMNEGLWRQLERGQIKREKLLAERFGRFMSEIGMPCTGAVSADMNRSYLDRLSQHPDILPGTLNVLDELAEVATLAVVSNGVERVQMQRVRESGIANYMEDVFISEKVGCEKPNRRIFEHALRTLGVEDRSHVLVVGDSLGGDIQGGINAGLDTCWFNPDRQENKTGIVPTYEIHSLEELYPIVMEKEELVNVGNKNRKHLAEI